MLGQIRIQISDRVLQLIHQTYGTGILVLLVKQSATRSVCKMHSNLTVDEFISQLYYTTEY